MLGFLDKIRLLSEWSPLLAYGQRLAASSDPHVRAVVVVEALKWLASKSDTPLDDVFAEKIHAVLVTPQGEDLVRTIAEEVSKLADKVPEIDE